MPLTPSQRATLVKEVGKRLSVQEWSFIDATLDAFSLPTTNGWEGKAVSYVLRMISNAKDEKLLELAEHVGFQFDARPLRVDPPFWRKDMFRLFISHLAAHRAFASDLQKALEDRGISSFVAHNDIEPTLEWQNESKPRFPLVRQ